MQNLSIRSVIKSQTFLNSFQNQTIAPIFTVNSLTNEEIINIDDTIVIFSPKQKKILKKYETFDTNEIICLEYLIEKESIFVLSNQGYVVEIDSKGKITKTEIIPENKEKEKEKFVACCLSPDQTYFVLLGSSGTLYELDEEYNCLVKGRITNKELIEASISFREDGKYFVCLYFDLEFNKNIVQVYDSDYKIFGNTLKEKTLQFSSSSIQFQPRGNVISVVSKDQKKVIFFEKNCVLREYSITCVDEEEIIKGLSWNVESNILALITMNRTTFLEKIQFWTFSNYHWYLKQTTQLTNGKNNSILWDNENPLLIRILNCNGVISYINLFWEISKSHLKDQTVALIDGKNALLSPFSKMVIPPPLSEYKINSKNSINHVLFSSKYVVLHTSANQLEIYTFNNEKNDYSMLTSIEIPLDQNLETRTSAISMTTTKNKPNSILFLIAVEAEDQLDENENEKKEMEKEMELEKEKEKDKEKENEKENTVDFVHELMAIELHGLNSNNSTFVREITKFQIDNEIIQITPLKLNHGFVIETNNGQLYSFEEIINQQEKETQNENENEKEKAKEKENLESNEGTEFKIVELNNFDEPCDEISTSIIVFSDKEINQEIIIGKNSQTNKLFIVGKNDENNLDNKIMEVSDSCTSFGTNNEFIAFTTLEHVVRFIPLKITENKSQIKKNHYYKKNQNRGKKNNKNQQKNNNANISSSSSSSSNNNNNNKVMTEFKKIIEKVKIQSIEEKYNESFRPIERSAKIVILTSDKIVFEMPRGNLETVYPRIMVLSTILKYLKEESKYKDALLCAKRHRIDLNIVCDWDFEYFKGDIKNFIEDIEDNGLLSKFIQSLKNEDTSITKFKFNIFNTETVGKTKVERIINRLLFVQKKKKNRELLKNKVSEVCKLLRKTMKEIDEDKYIMPIIDTYLKPRPIEIPKMFQDLRARFFKKTYTKRSELDYAIYLTDIKTLYDTAIEMCDFELAQKIAQKSEMDPMEYIPFLKKLKNEKNANLKNAEIFIYLERWEKAIFELISEKSNQSLERALNLIEEKSLYSQSLKIIEKIRALINKDDSDDDDDDDEEKEKEKEKEKGEEKVKSEEKENVDNSEFILKLNKFEMNIWKKLSTSLKPGMERALALNLAGNTEETVIEYQKIGNWKMAIALNKYSSPELLLKISEQLEDRDQFKESAQVLFEYTLITENPQNSENLQNKELIKKAIQLLLRSGDYSGALKLISFKKCFGLIETVVLPELDNNYLNLLHSINDKLKYRENIQRKLNNLQLRKLQFPQFYALDKIGQVDLSSTLISDNSSVSQYSTYSNQFSSKNKGNNQKNRRKKNRKEKIKESESKAEENWINELSKTFSPPILEKILNLTLILVHFGKIDKARIIQNKMKYIIKSSFVKRKSIHQQIMKKLKNEPIYIHDIKEDDFNYLLLSFLN
ncbi:elongator complex protein [Anaeramoeba flamelloides]|uniref:Elongator complex protein 1 n=1 Tax=Anaeramoeba flamelloides TaxID=1746091 RepID=A0ABQ8X7G9_9EUKA|nr:elongator complex protein [Anaeramoeba flamelloides]